MAKGASVGDGEAAGGEVLGVDGAFGVVKDRLGRQGNRVEEVEDMGSGMEPMEPQGDIGKAGLEFDGGIHPSQGGDGGRFGWRVEGEGKRRSGGIHGRADLQRLLATGNEGRNSIRRRGVKRRIQLILFLRFHLPPPEVKGLSGALVRQGGGLVPPSTSVAVGH